MILKIPYWISQTTTDPFFFLSYVSRSWLFTTDLLASSGVDIEDVEQFPPKHSYIHTYGQFRVIYPSLHL